MQKKESKTNTHFWFSVIKSGFRFGAGLAILLPPHSLYSFAILFIVAEVLGIAEEIF